MDHFLIWCGVLVAPVFISIFLIEGYLRKGYLPLRQPVSALAIGPRGWIQRANFFITGALALLYAFSLQGWGSILTIIFGAGLVGAGVFVTDVTGSPKQDSGPVIRSRAGLLHDIFSLPVFMALLVNCFVFAQGFSASGEDAWTVYSRLSGILLAVFFVFAGVGFSGSPKFAHIGGLMQRLSISIGWIWLSVVALHLL
ncbi:MAG: hypothetical protein JWM46_712 [Candidatus Kaiserbacteria bacterium]|nr:hypothetical protein [Candidatus Kaiserbacteria bacterium]